MPFKLRKTIPGKLNGDIYQWEDIHGERLFEQRLYQNVQQNSKVQNVRIRPLHKYMDIYENIEEWSIKEYRVPETLLKCEWVFRSLNGIRFTQLKILNLQCLQINNIQCLSWLQAPYLQKIDFSDNKIVSIKSLKKFSLPNLLMGMDLSQNPISQLGFIHMYDMIIRSINNDQEFQKTHNLIMDIYTIDFLNQ